MGFTHLTFFFLEISQITLPLITSLNFLTKLRMNLQTILTNSEGKYKNRPLAYISAIWTFIILMPLVPFPTPSVVVGHPWKVELVISFFLFIISFIYLIKKQNTENVFLLPANVISWIITPCSIFILWSASSIFWANSVLSAAHHTLLWGIYLIFFCFVLQIVVDKRYLQISIFSLGSVIGIIAVCCIVEYTFSAQISEPFGFRYSKFAETFASVLPLFFSLILRSGKKNLLLNVLLTFAVWLAILLSLSRGALISSVVGLIIFILLRLFSKIVSAEKKRIFLATSVLILLTIFIQTPIFSSVEQKSTTLSRMEQESSSGFSKSIRFLFAGVGLEMFSKNTLHGIGADNFGLEFNKYRVTFSDKSENKPLVEQQESLLPERAHNEYLQIAAELGAVGAIIFLCFLSGIVKLGLQEIKRNLTKSSNIITQAAMAGIIAFLTSSLFSSFSFRLAQNGIVFFFLLAILLRNCFVETGRQKVVKYPVSPLLTKSFAIVFIFICLSLTVFSTLKATSQYFVYQAERQAEFGKAEFYYKKATMLDPANGSANYSFGLRLLNEGLYRQSATQLQQAAVKGLNTTVCYSYLISAQFLASDYQAAEQTTAEAVKIFPYSVFMRVRYSSLLYELGKEKEGDQQFELAKQFDSRQAESWRLLISNGAMAISEKTKTDKDIISVDKLNPNPAVYAILAERELRFPEERESFNFDNLSF